MTRIRTKRLEKKIDTVMGKISVDLEEEEMPSELQMPSNAIRVRRIIS